MNGESLTRVLSVVLSIAAVVLLIWFWKNDRRNMSFIPLLMVALALFLSRKRPS